MEIAIPRAGQRGKRFFKPLRVRQVTTGQMNAIVLAGDECNEVLQV